MKMDFTWVKVSRYVIYLLLFRIFQKLLTIFYRPRNGMSLNKFLYEMKIHLLMLTIASSIIVYSGDFLVLEDFMLLSLALIVVKHPELLTHKTISYGTGMACIFFEDYLAYVLPANAVDVVDTLSFQEQDAIRTFRGTICRGEFRRERIYLFPVFFIVVTKSLFCPACPTYLNKVDKQNRAYLEKLLFAGIDYAYKIVRPGDSPPVNVAVKLATPLHTIQRVLGKPGLYQQFTDMDTSELVDEFCSQLEQTIERSPECRGKCVLVHYNDLDPNENFADVLLAKIEKIKSELNL